MPTNLKVPSAQFPNTSFAGWHPVKLTNGFVCGQNCLDFYVTNAYTVVNPTGFRAQLTNVFNNCCCEPSQTIKAGEVDAQGGCGLRDGDKGVDVRAADVDVNGSGGGGEVGGRGAQGGCPHDVRPAGAVGSGERGNAH